VIVSGKPFGFHISQLATHDILPARIAESKDWKSAGSKFHGTQIPRFDGAILDISALDVALMRLFNLEF
jgi:hypothetical protein